MAQKHAAMDSKPLCHLHFVFIPLMAPGHLLPLVDMAKLFARRNVKVSIVTTPLNSIHFRETIDREIQYGSPIQILHVPFPNEESGIPEGCESVDTLPSMDLLDNFFIALRLLQQPLEALLEKLTPSPSCIVADKNVSCVADIANKMNVPRIMFDGTSCFTLLCNHILHETYEAVEVSFSGSSPHLEHSAYNHRAKIRGPQDSISGRKEGFPDEEKFLVLGLPHRIEFRKCQLPLQFSKTNKMLDSFREEIMVAAENSHGVVVNSFEELEVEYVKEYQRVKAGYKVWCVGPVSLSNKDELDKAQRGLRNSNDVSQILKWLDSWPPSSVIYVCLGSLNRATPKQLIEIGLGLEATKRPFIWVLRGAYGREELEKWLLEEGFEERVKGRGILIKGWAPQVLILSHKAIGAFLTHCGWNSTLEGICAGVPLVTFPMFAEQFYNEKVVVQVVEIGVSLGAETVVHLGEEEKSDHVQVKRESVRDSIEMVMGEGEEKEKMRERARRYADMARKAIEEGGSSYRNISLLIEDIIVHVQGLD